MGGVRKTGQDKQIISAAEAGRLLGVSAQMVRERMKAGAWRIGLVTKTKTGYKYDVSLYLLRKQFGIGGNDGKTSEKETNID